MSHSEQQSEKEDRISQLARSQARRHYMAKTTTHDFAKQNPAFEGDVTDGNPGEHSTTEPSTDHMCEADHAQFDEALQNVPPPQDPNISGATPTETTYTWQAGQLSGWQENDDYRDFLEAGKTPVSRLSCYFNENDGDYDDNGGHPTAIGHGVGYHRPVDMTGDATFGQSIVIMRRI